MKREHNKEIEQDVELLSYFTCDNNIIDQVSGVTYSNSGSSYAGPLYVVDPEDSTKYCVKKRSGEYYIVPPLVVYDKNNSKFINLFNYYNNNICTRVNHMKIEFDVYITNSTTNRIIVCEGDVGYGVGNNGYTLRIYSSNLYVFYANNSSSTTNIKIADLSDVCNKWNHVSIEYVPNSGLTNCTITITISNSSNTYTWEQTLDNITSSSYNRIVICSCHHYGYYNNLPDTIDCFKEMKIWKYK